MGEAWAAFEAVNARDAGVKSWLTSSFVVVFQNRPALIDTQNARSAMQERLAFASVAAAAPSSSGRKELERLPSPDACEFPAGVDFVDYGDSLDLATSLGGADQIGADQPEIVVDPLARVERVQIRGRTSRVRTAAAESDDEDEENVTTPNLHQWAPLDVAPAPNAHKRRLEETPPDRRLVTKLRRINGHWYVALPNPF